MGRDFGKASGPNLSPRKEENYKYFSAISAPRHLVVVLCSVTRYNSERLGSKLAFLLKQTPERTLNYGSYTEYR